MWQAADGTRWPRWVCLASLTALTAACAQLAEPEPVAVEPVIVDEPAPPRRSTPPVSAPPPRTDGVVAGSEDPVSGNTSTITFAPGEITPEEALVILQSGQDLTQEQYDLLLSVLDFHTATIEPAAGPEIDLLPALIPWPPPPASLAVPLKRELLLAEIGEDEPELGTVGDFIEDALYAAGYDGRVRFVGLQADASGVRFPDEFAIVTGMEQIDENARPLTGPRRWAENIERDAEFSLRGFLRALFFAPKGRYRVLVFIVTQRPMQGRADEPMSTELVERFGEEGTPVLPEPLRGQAFGARHQVIALIYEFEKLSDDQEARHLRPSPRRASEHLAHTRLAEFTPGP